MSYSCLEVVRNLLDLSPLKLARAGKRCALKLAESFYGSHLTESQLRELALMRRDNVAANAPFVASQHWKKVVSLFEDVFFREGIQNPEEQTLNLRFSGFPLRDERLHRYICWMYQKLLEPRDKLELLGRLRATCAVQNGLAYQFDSRILSLDLLLSIDDFYNLYEISPAIATEPVVVAELGAGWGRLGYVLQTINHRASYVIFDLPEVLLISQSYLPTLFPNSVARRYSENRNMRFSKALLQNANFWFLGPQQMPLFEANSIDYIINIASFQEMPEADVESYLHYFSVLASGGNCYLRQLYSGRTHKHELNEIPGFSSYKFPDTWRRHYLRKSTLSDAFFEVGFSIPHGSTM
jgi:putative sugar O-methyltransferase